VEIEVVSQRAV